MYAPSAACQPSSPTAASPSFPRLAEICASRRSSDETAPSISKVSASRAASIAAHVNAPIGSGRIVNCSDTPSAGARREESARSAASCARKPLAAREHPSAPCRGFTLRVNSQRSTREYPRSCKIAAFSNSTAEVALSSSVDASTRGNVRRARHIAAASDSSVSAGAINSSSCAQKGKGRREGRRDSDPMQARESARMARSSSVALIVTVATGKTRNTGISCLGNSSACSTVHVATNSTISPAVRHATAGS
mmetsp:Transcript_34573/g.86248  ORF Transcript_34573/g.86248 Transcript_34573/m.86248 type:complete len:251 (-) Transcript_34573:2862-3614(-)